MNPAERLFALYDRVADAPEAVPRLRRFVLDLAVRGKLVEQDPADKPASELLKQIAAEKAQFVKTGAIKSRLYPSNGDLVDPPFTVPETWCWCQLNAIGCIVGGGTPSAADPTNFSEPGEGIPWLTPADLGGYKEQYIKRGARDLTEKGLRSSSATMMPTGTVLFTSRAPIGYVTISANPIATNQGFKSIVPYMADCSHFIALVMRAFAQEIDANAPGTTFREVSGKIVAGIYFPLPPLAEQHRIVARANEMMALCDRLEASREKREKIRDRLTKASLYRLSRLDTDLPTFRSHARFAIKALPALTSRADQIKQLRQSILDLAVRGKLVEQNPADEPASELLKRIVAEKTRLMHPRKTKGPALPEPFSTDDNPFPLPQTWIWSRIADLGVLSPRNHIDDDHTASFVPMPLIPAEWGKTNAHKSRSWGEIKKGYTHFAEGDVGLAKITPCFENRKSVVFRNLTGGSGSGTTELHIVRPVLMNANYILLFLKSSLFIENGISRMTGTAGQKRVPKEYFANSPFPLPPLAEQHRIVAKVDELMAFCDRLEADLEVTSKNRQSCLDLLVQKAL